MATDVFRKRYKQISVTQAREIEDIKTKAQELWDLLVGGDAQEGQNPPPPDGMDARYAALARTHLELVVLWAVKGLTG